MGGGRILRYPSREIPLMAAGPAASQASSDEPWADLVVDWLREWEEVCLGK
jgi:hypothetical protein